MKTENIQKIGVNGMSGRRRTNHTSNAGIEKYARAINASEMMWSASTSGFHR